MAQPALPEPEDVDPNFQPVTRHREVQQRMWSLRLGVEVKGFVLFHLSLCRVEIQASFVPLSLPNKHLARKKQWSCDARACWLTAEQGAWNGCEAGEEHMPLLHFYCMYVPYCHSVAALLMVEKSS